MDETLVEHFETAEDGVATKGLVVLMRVRSHHVMQLLYVHVPDVGATDEFRELSERCHQEQSHYLHMLRVQEGPGGYCKPVPMLMLSFWYKSM